jgi:hypothetical protein
MIRNTSLMIRSRPHSAGKHHAATVTRMATGVAVDAGRAAPALVPDRDPRNHRQVLVAVPAAIRRRKDSGAAMIAASEATRAAGQRSRIQ